MQEKSGNNTRPKITEIQNFFTDYSDKEELRNLAENYAKDNLQGTSVRIKDNKTLVDFSRSGLTKTFGKNRDNVKMQTAEVLDDIIKEGVYVNSSKSTDPNITYHYYYSPISYEDKNSISLITIKEITTEKSANDKFYYHDIRRIENLKEENPLYLPHENVSNKFGGNSPQSNNSITQKNENVKSEKNTIV